MQNIYLLNLIKLHRPHFSAVEEKLADYLMRSDDSDLVSKTITDMSRDSEVSQTTIYNFVKKLGFSGFQNFKIQIASNPNQPLSQPPFMVYHDLSKADSPKLVADKIMHSTLIAMESMRSYLNYDSIGRIVDIISQSHSLNFFGQGGSSSVAYDAYHKFLRSMLHCNYIQDYHIQLVYTTKLNQNDCAFIFSHTGETHETLHIAEALRASGCKVISLTGNPNSKLIPLSNESIVVHSDESKFKAESLTSRILYLTVIDIIYTLIMFKNEEANAESLNKIRNVLTSTRD